jgi:hypothetical protein
LSILDCPFLTVVHSWLSILDCPFLVVHYGQPRMDNQEWTTKNGQSSRMDNQEWTIKNGQPRMDNPKTIATLGTQDTGRWQTKQTKTQYVLNTTMPKQT